MKRLRCLWILPVLLLVSCVDPSYALFVKADRLRHGAVDAVALRYARTGQPMTPRQEKDYANFMEAWDADLKAQEARVGGQ